MACHAAMERARRTNVWRRVASPARRAKRLTIGTKAGEVKWELRETTIDRLRKRLGRDPTEEEIKAERDRKWRFALADMGITAECFLDEK